MKKYLVLLFVCTFPSRRVSLQRTLRLECLSILLFVCTFFACAKKSEDPTENPIPFIPPSSTYTPQWKSLKQGEYDSCYIKNGSMYIANKHHTKESGGGSISSGASSTFRISGDCEIKIKFSDYAPTVTSVLKDLVNITIRDEAFSTAALFYAYLSNGYIAIQNVGHANPSKSTYGKEGEFYLKREGGTYTTWFRAVEDTVFYDVVDYPTGDLTITLGIATTQDSDPVKRAHVQIDEVLVYDHSGKQLVAPFNSKSISYIDPE